MLKCRSKHANTTEPEVRGTSLENSSKLLPSRQFGVSLSFIKENNENVAIPPIVSQCVEFLSQPDGNFSFYY